MTIHWKAVELYFTVVLFVNPLSPRVKPWVIQSFLTFDLMDRTLKRLRSIQVSFVALILFDRVFRFLSMTCIRGSIHQGHEAFSEHSRGRQCAFVSLAVRFSLLQT